MVVPPMQDGAQPDEQLPGPRPVDTKWCNKCHSVGLAEGHICVKNEVRGDFQSSTVVSAVSLRPDRRYFW